MKFLTEKNQFIAQRDLSSKTRIGILGIPYDCTASFRPGSRFAPNAIRTASISIETYSPRLDKDLEDIYFTDFGDVPCVFGDPLINLEIIKKYHLNLLKKKIKIICAGGEHLITYPLIKNLIDANPKSQFTIAHFDAHLDLRNDYLGNNYSHATVMNLISKEKNVSKIIQIGTRSGSREEYSKREKNAKITIAKTPAQLKEFLAK